MLPLEVMGSFQGLYRQKVEASRRDPSSADADGGPGLNRIYSLVAEVSDKPKDCVSCRLLLLQLQTVFRLAVSVTRFPVS